MIIRIGLPRKCAFTNNPANESLVIGHYKDRHNPCKKIPSCKEYVEFRTKNMNPQLYDLEVSVFLEYWRLESELSVKSASKIDSSKLEKLQDLILDMMSKVKGTPVFDFEKELKKRLDTLLDRKPDLAQFDSFDVLKDK